MILVAVAAAPFAYWHAVREAAVAQARQTALIKAYMRAGIPATFPERPERPNPPLPPEFDPFRQHGAP